MRGIWRILIVIPAAFIAACFGAALVIVIGAGAEPNPGELSGDFAAKLIVIALIASMVVGAVAAVPALIMVLLAEAFGWRSLILHLIVGAGIGFAAFAVDIGGRSEVETDIALGGGAGAVAGFVYWLIAGRNAGRNRRLHDTA
jgi:hypothetical protein